MQRIDENTYIDDTLVTCAEYQLFIEEMREQGKYYQPDHWTSYQFPDGQAREPIIGVRYLDALAFCRWLTLREGGRWMYRLPIPKEAANYPIKPFAHLPIGYWIMNADDPPQIIWVGPVPNNARGINNALDRARALDPDRFINFSRNPNRAREDARVRARVLELAHTIDRTGNQPLNLDRVASLASAVSFEVELKFSLVHVLNRASSLDRDFDLTYLLDRIFELAFTLNHEVDRTFDLYLNIYTFNERVAGRSPAFEGIRLVKERVK